VLGPDEYAYDQAHLLTLSEIDPLNVEVFVPLAQYGWISVGGAATVAPEAPVPDASVPSTQAVRRVWRSAGVVS
jgi:hypothetical protein